jgi:hypothetical protein
VQKAYPKAKLVQYDPAIARDVGAEKRAERSVRPGRADVIVSLDADFLSGASYPGFHKLVRDYAKRRKSRKKLNRLYAIESTPTTTGHEGRASAGAAGERDSGVCGGAGARRLACWR